MSLLFFIVLNKLEFLDLVLPFIFILDEHLVRSILRDSGADSLVLRVLSLLTYIG